jgi:membrane protein YdbS with pleckstrin-like domain
MDTIVVKPQREQRTVWLIHWALVFFPICICLIVLILVNPIIFGICTAVWVVFMVPFLFWIPAYFRSLQYAIADDVVKGQRGVFWKRFITIPYHKITNVDITQGPLQRNYHVGTIHCQTAGAGGQQGATAELKMEGVGDLEGLKEAIMERVKGIALSRLTEAQRGVGEMEESETLRAILRELTTMRGLLEKQTHR